jgi:predicted lipoprotein with Yx(FWY)xxD motif
MVPAPNGTTRWERTIRSARWVVALAALSLAAAACGSSSGTGTTTTTAAATDASQSGASIRVASVSGLGKVLVDSKGLTLYVFSKDKHGVSTCSTGACAAAWPPLFTSGKPAAGSGVESSLLGTVKDPNGKLQVTYDHRPLYTYAGDTSAGQANGQGLSAFGGKWATITASGTVVSKAASSSGGSGW